MTMSGGIKATKPRAAKPRSRCISSTWEERRYSRTTRAPNGCLTQALGLQLCCRALIPVRPPGTMVFRRSYVRWVRGGSRPAAARGSHRGAGRAVTGLRRRVSVTGPVAQRTVV